MVLAAFLVAMGVFNAEASPARVDGSVAVSLAGGRCGQAAYGAGGAAQTELVVDVRVYGNHTIPLADILALTGPVAGRPASASLLRDVRRRLEQSGRFARVDVRSRSLSTGEPKGILLVIVVEEPVAIGAGDLTAAGSAPVPSSSIWVPVLDYRDGRYIYGARLSLENAFGPRSRVSMPFTWGGQRQARVEVERRFENAPVARLAGGGGVNRSNPFSGEGDTSSDAWARVESALRSWLRAGGEARLIDGNMGTDDRLTTIGADLVLDTRKSVSEQQKGVYAALGFKRLSFDATSVAANEDIRGSTSASRMTFDGRASVGIFRMSVLGVSANPASPDRPLPAVEQSLLGGIPSLRSFDAWSRANDNLAGAALEMLVPISPPTNLGNMGVKVFADATAVYSGDESLADQQFGRSYGAGVYLDGSTFSVGMDLGWPEQGGGPNAQVQVGMLIR